MRRNCGGDFGLSDDYLFTTPFATMLFSCGFLHLKSKGFEPPNQRFVPSSSRVIAQLAVFASSSFFGRQLKPKLFDVNQFLTSSRFPNRFFALLQNKVVLH